MALSYDRLKQLYEKNLANGRTEIAAALFREMQRVNPGLGTFRRLDDYYTPSNVVPASPPLAEVAPQLIETPTLTVDSGYYRAPRYDSGTGVNNFANNLGREGNRVVVAPSGNASNWANTYDYEGATYGGGSPSLVKAPVDFDIQYPMTGNDKIDYPEAYDENGYNYGGFHSLADQGLGEDNSLPLVSKGWGNKSLVDLYKAWKSSKG